MWVILVLGGLVVFFCGFGVLWLFVFLVLLLCAALVFELVGLVVCDWFALMFAIDFYALVVSDLLFYTCCLLA